MSRQRRLVDPGGDRGRTAEHGQHRADPEHQMAAGARQWRDPHPGRSAGRGGEQVGAVRTIVSDDQQLRPPRVVYQPRAREYLVVWVDVDGESLDRTDTLFARRLDRSGEPLGPAVMVTPRHTDIASYAVAARPNRRGYLVAWNRTDPEGVGVETRALNGRAQPTGPVRAIASVLAKASVRLVWSGRERRFVFCRHLRRGLVQGPRLAGRFSIEQRHTIDMGWATHEK